MEDSQQYTANRRDVMKAAGGATATAAMGGAFAGTAAAAHDDDEYKGVRVDQVGYPIDDHKHAIATSQAMDVSSVSTFEVVDADTGETALEGTLSSAKEDEFGTSHTVKWADFTELDEPGEYKVVVGDEESYPFTVDDASEVYKETLRDVGRLYTLKRSNTRVEDDYTGLSYGPGHQQDEEAIVAEADFLSDVDGLSAGDTISVPNGWYDAGDYGKYVNPQAVSVAQLMLAFERNPEAFHVGQFHAEQAVDDPEWGDMPDVLVECKQALKFLKQMQRPDGGLFYKLAGADGWPSMTAAPEDDDLDRYVFGDSSVGTAHGCAAFAMAARVYEDHDSAFADEMLQAAEDAWAWLEDNDFVWEQSVNQDEGSGAYGRADDDTADRYWAAAELYRTTGDSTYDDWIVETDLEYVPYEGADPVELPGDVEAPIDWNNPVGLAQYAYYWADGTDAGTSDTDGAAGGLTSSIWVAQRYFGGSNADEEDVYSTGVYDFYWGVLKSGVSRGVQGIFGAEVYEDLGNSWITGEDVYEQVTGPLHHVLGRSATGYSYVTANGEKSSWNPHDRILQSQKDQEGFEGTIPGMLVGGPHQELYEGLDGDDTSDHVPEGTDPGMSYADIHGSYATNEWAINYTAPLFMMLAEVVGEINETPEPDYDWDEGSDDDDDDNQDDNCADVDGQTVCDVNGDGLYRDVTGNGEVGQTDVVEFFNVQHRDAWKQPSMFDFSGNGSVGHGDVVELFEYVATMS